MRQLLTVWHRIVGLTIAVFLFVSGITGAIISWDHELDDLINPHLHDAKVDGPAMPSLELARLVEVRDPRVQVAAIALVAEPGHTLSMHVNPRVDPQTGRPYDLEYNEVFVEPATGDEVGRRNWGAAWPLSRENFVSFLYILHFSLHVPALFGTPDYQIGMWIMGAVAVLWTIDTVAAFFLTLPPRKTPSPSRSLSVNRELSRGFWARWKPAWKIKTSGSAYRITFDIHRAFSLWTWLLLFVLAFTAFSLNLYREIFYPVMSMVSQVTPGPFETRTAAPRDEPIERTLPWEILISKAQAEAERRDWKLPVGSVYYSPKYGIFAADFFVGHDDHGSAGVGPPRIMLDGKTGEYLGDEEPWVGTAADIFVQAQFPIHSGRILGLPGRILISFMGLVVAALSVTGVVIWWKKRKARVSRVNMREHRHSSRPAPAE